MDPLVDEYNQTKMGNINGEVMAKSVLEVRKFIVIMTLTSIGLFLVFNILVV